MVSRQVNTRYFLFALVPIGIFWMQSVIAVHLLPADLNVPLDILQNDHPWLESVGRYRFIAATWFFAAFVVLAVALVVRDLASPTARATRIAAIATMLVILVLALLPTILGHTGPDGPHVYGPLGVTIFEATLAHGTLPGCHGADDIWLLGRCGEVPVLSMFRRLMDLINILAGLGVGALIVGMILCLETRIGGGIEGDIVLLKQNFRRMRQQLYLSSLILTFGMFFATSWMHWPMPMIVGAERAAYGSVVTAASLFTGVYFSLLILGIYLPVALILDGRAQKLALMAGQEAEGHDVDDWRAGQGLKERVGDLLRAGFALVAPILAAFAGGISPISL